MDVNNVPFWQWRGASAFGLGPDAPFPATPDTVAWDAADNALTIARGEPEPELVEDEARARDLINRPSAICDSVGSFAWWDDASGHLLASGFALDPIRLADGLDDNPVIRRPSDMGFADDVAWLARDGKVAAIDMRQRWPVEIARANGFNASLISAAPASAPWALAIDTGKIARVLGSPMPEIARRVAPDDAFVPDDPDPEDLRIRIEADVRIPDPLEPVALRAGPDDQLAILCWNPGENAELLIYRHGEELRRQPLAGIRFPISLAWDGDDQLCLLATDGAGLANRVFAFDVAQIGQTDAPLTPNGRFIPLIDHAGHGLCDGPWEQAFHIVQRERPQPHLGLQRLRSISRLGHARAGSVMIGPIDSGRYDCDWHRFYCEARFPEGCGARIALHASNRPSRPDTPANSANREGWALHLAGSATAWENAPEDLYQPQWPRAAWSHSASEIAGHTGFLPCPREQGKAGLFSCLIQDGRTQVRRVSGRYLYLHLELTGDGQRSPELYGLRVYGNRFSYRDRYLPELYGETVSGPDAAEAGNATGADFLERLVHLMEGPMTEIEGRVAQGWTVSDPLTVPADGLDWLASWTGFDFGDDTDLARKRQKLLCAPHLRRLNGTLAGLNAILELETGGHLIRGGQFDPDLPAPRPGQLAQIEIAGQSYRALVLSIADPRGGGQAEVLIGGGVTRGSIVTLEGFRLRRTFATILGADLADESDPMLLGMVRSGNSVVGDSLILGAEERADLLAHFRSDLPMTASEEDDLAEFYRKLAHSVMVLVHKETLADPVDAERLMREARGMAPAHVETTLLRMTAPFMVGAASLVGIDSFLTDPAQPDPFRVESSDLSSGDVLMGTGALDRRSDGPVDPAPVAHAAGPDTVSSSDGFWLDASNSAAARGRRINRYIWTWQ
ncbi:phage tail protein [Parerythrobacter jejuensis]|uniref:Phage tail protein n=1 Tax=Parerythrobacter jejuensis TaxID=795812 RepID=A0A845AT14_9SPHN|nr:phage tail protein [Parerythrobacter jejuensis]MXP31262.1 hypothetical protein [Parerythrobacter jejuensis]MXP34022.1 hypothetical protein [Parerythrobacter jejuensis]